MNSLESQFLLAEQLMAHSQQRAIIENKSVKALLEPRSAQREEMMVSLKNS